MGRPFGITCTLHLSVITRGPLPISSASSWTSQMRLLPKARLQPRLRWCVQVAGHVYVHSPPACRPHYPSSATRILLLAAVSDTFLSLQAAEQAQTPSVYALQSKPSDPAQPPVREVQFTEGFAVCLIVSYAVTPFTSSLLARTCVCSHRAQMPSGQPSACRCNPAESV